MKEAVGKRFADHGRCVPADMASIFRVMGKPFFGR